MPDPHQPPEPGHRSGFVSVVGLPNVGKSTLINAFLKRAVLITSVKPQTTRHEIRCVVTDARRQIVFVDTPGFVPGRARLDGYMRKEIYRAKTDVDVLLYLVDATRPAQRANLNCWKALTRDASGARILVLNKIDRFRKVELIPVLEEVHRQYQPDELVPVSALETTNLDALDRIVTDRLPEGPLYYPDDVETDRPLEFLIAEFIREPLYSRLREEMPFACAVRVESLKETPRALHVEAVILVERDSQKGILIGEGGSMIESLRVAALRRIETYIQPRSPHLKLTVRVQKNWRTDERVLRSLYGF